MKAILITSHLQTTIRSSSKLCIYRVVDQDLTFKARVALASWVNTPFLPPGVPASIIADARKPKAKPNGKEKAKEVIIESHEKIIEIDDSDSDSN